MSANHLNAKRNWARPSAWYNALTFCFSVYLAFGDEGFNFVAFLLAYGTFVIIGLPFRTVGWLTARFNSRPCPVCGRRVRNGQTSCESCGTDYRLR